MRSWNVEEQQAGRLRIRPGRIVSTAEVLEPEVRSQVHDTWSARVLNSYGTTEAGLLGSECDSSAGIHIAEDMIVFEVVDEQNRPVPDGVPGAKVLMTNLFNRVLPLIRYELSDIATLDQDTCECGRPYARVTAIDGRREDYMTLRARRWSYSNSCGTTACTTRRRAGAAAVSARADDGSPLAQAVGSRRYSSRDDKSLGDGSGQSRPPVGWCGCHGDDAGGRQHRASRHGRERKARGGGAYCLTYFVTPRSCASAVYTFPAASIAMPSPIAPSAEFGAM